MVSHCGLSLRSVIVSRAVAPDWVGFGLSDKYVFWPSLGPRALLQSATVAAWRSSLSSELLPAAKRIRY